VKISPRTVLKIARLYHLADDNTPVKALRHLKVQTDESHIVAEFILNKQHFAVLYGSIVDEESIDELWPGRPVNTEVLPNPLDASCTETPFQGKFVMMFRIVPTKQRLDVHLSTAFDPSISRSLWQKYIKAGHVSVNHQVVTAPKFEVDETDEIAVKLPEQEQASAELPILYEDDDVIVVNKPSGLLTHAKGGLSTEPTVAEIIRPKTSLASDTDRPGIVHRLDRDTSGILIIAKNPDAAAHLQRQFAQRTTKKTYLAATDGSGPAPRITLSWPRTVSTPWLIPGIIVGGLLLLAGVFGLLIDIQMRRADSQRRQRAAERAARLATADSVILASGKRPKRVNTDFPYTVTRMSTSGENLGTLTGILDVHPGGWAERFKDPAAAIREPRVKQSRELINVETGASMDISDMSVDDVILPTGPGLLLERDVRTEQGEKEVKVGWMQARAESKEMSVENVTPIFVAAYAGKVEIEVFSMGKE